MSDTGAHYRHEYRGVKIDPYRIIDTYGITHPAHQHALKKLLRCGRSIKDLDADIQEVIDSLTRWQEMRAEDGPPVFCADPDAPLTPEAVANFQKMFSVPESQGSSSGHKQPKS